MTPSEDTLDAAIGQYLELAEAGRAPDVDAFVAEHPAHRTALLSFLADHRAMCAAMGEAPHGVSHAAASAGSGKSNSLGWSIEGATPGGCGNDLHDAEQEAAASASRRGQGAPSGDRYQIVG